MRQTRRNSPSSLSQRSAQTSDSSEKSSRRCDGLKPTRKRASKPKVRTGCISCKRRHVKCDEGKPSCAECERLGLMCEGYAPPKVKTTSCRPERLLLPKPKLASVQPAKIAALSQPVDYRSPTPLMPTFGFELNDDDKWYFTLFRDQISRELSPYFRSNFWSQTSLRDSMVNRCIHHSILSIGAYGRALMDLREGYTVNGKMCRTWWPPSVLNRHHQAALVHHAKALSHLRSNIRTFGIDGRLTMAATLLFIVFENMQGNYLSSGNLIRSGIKVLKNIRGGGDSKSILRRQWYRCLSTPRDEVDEMTIMFARHSVATACVPFAHGKFAYHILLTEDEDEDGDTGLDGPFTFSAPQTLEQARQIWDHLMVQIASFQSKIAWHNSNPEYDFDEPAAFREQAMYLAQLTDLGVALDSLLFSTVDSRDRQGLELLRMHHTIASVSTSCCFDSTEMMYDQYIPQFEDVVQRCKQFADFPSELTTKIGFINEAGRLPLLAFVGMKCRKASVRQEAVQLLLRCDWREATWDSENLASVVTGIMKLEGQLDPIDPDCLTPAKDRYRWTNIFWDFEKRQMLLEYTKALPDELGEFHKVSYVMGV